jgi:hypothetical protein
MNNAFINLAITTRDTAQAMAEFGAELKSYRSKYHPFIWWILQLLCRE